MEQQAEPSAEIRKVPRFLAGIALLVAAVLLPACTKRPDLTLMPVNDSLCEDSGDRRTSIEIVNKGKGSAKATTTELVFSGTAPVRLPTRPVEPDGKTSLSYRVPDRCSSESCYLRITVDVKNEVDEKDETNNSLEGACSGR